MLTAMKRVGALAVGLVIGQAVLYFCTPVLSRLYGPEAFGKAQLFLASMTIVGTLATLRFETQIAKSGDDDAVRAARIALLAAALVSVGAFSGVGLVTGDWPMSILLAVSIFAMAVTLVLTQYAVRCEELNGLAASKAVQGFSQAGVPLAVAGTLRSVGLELGIAMSYVAAAATQVLGLRETRRILRYSEKLELIGFFRDRWRSSVTLTLSTGANVLVVWNAPVVIEWISGADEVGLAAIAQRIVAVPIGIFVAALAPIVLGWVGRKFRSAADPTAALRTLLFPLAVGGIGIALVMLFIPDKWWILILGDEWSGVQDYLASYSPYVLGLVMAGPFGQLIAVFGRARVQLLWDFSRLGAVVILVFLALSQGWSATGYLWSTNSTLCGFYILYIVLMLRELRIGRDA